MNQTEVPPSAILVVCLRYLGDTLLLRPALRALRAKFPDARLNAVVTSGTAAALDDCADVSRVIEWPRRNWLKELDAHALHRLFWLRLGDRFHGE